MSGRNYYKPMSARKVITVLLKSGFAAVRQSGSHRSFYNSRTKKLVIVPMHNGKDLPPGTVKSIFKQSGISK